MACSITQKPSEHASAAGAPASAVWPSIQVCFGFNTPERAASSSATKPNSLAQLRRYASSSFPRCTSTTPATSPNCRSDGLMRFQARSCSASKFHALAKQSLDFCLRRSRMLAADSQSRHFARQFVESQRYAHPLFASHLTIPEDLGLQRASRCHWKFGAHSRT